MNKSAMQAESWLPWGKSSHALALEMQGCLSAAADGSGHASTLPTMPIPIPSLTPPSSVSPSPITHHHQSSTQWLKVAHSSSHMFAWFKTPLFPLDHAAINISRYLSTAKDGWHGAGGLRHAAGLVSSNSHSSIPSSRDAESRWEELPCILLNSSSIYPGRIRYRQIHPLPFLTLVSAWLLVQFFAKNMSSCLCLLQHLHPLLPTSCFASDINCSVAISLFSWGDLLLLRIFLLLTILKLCP